MYQERDFWEAIARGGEDDDTPCWMYADWLEDQGDVRSEFVRAQCEMARLPPWSPLRAQLAVKSEQLLQENVASWADAFQHIDFMQLHFRRGVVTDVEWTARRFLEQGEELLELAPTITRINLHDVAQYADELAASCLWSRFTHVDMSRCELDDKLFARLVRDVNVSRIQVLDLSSNELTGASVMRMLNSDWLSDAAWGLAFNRLDGAVGEMIRTVAEQRTLQVKQLSLRGNRLGDPGFQALASSPLPALERLDLRDNNLSERAARGLHERATRLPALNLLDVRENSLREAGAVDLSGISLLNSVEQLQIRNNGIGSRGAEALATSPHIQQLKALGMGGNQIRGDCLQQVLGVEGLRYLDLSGNLIYDRGVRTILDLIDQTELEMVDLTMHHFSTRTERLLRQRGDSRIRF